MDHAPLSLLVTRTRDLLLARWKPLVAAVVATALADGLLWVVAEKLLSGATGGESGGAPSFGTVAVTLTLVWAIIVAVLVLPMAAATAALTDTEDAPIAWWPRALKSLPAQWLRLALPTLPLLLLMLWLMQSVTSLMKRATAGQLTSDPGTPLPFKIVEQLGQAPVRWALFIVAVGIWFLWSTTFATGRDERLAPRAFWRLHGVAPLHVAILVAISALAIGPVLSKAAGGVGSSLSGLGPQAADAASASSGVGIIIVFGALLAAFIGAVAVPWIALFSTEGGWSVPDDGTGTPALAPAVDAATPQPQGAVAAEAPVAAAPAHRRVESVLEAQAGTPAGAWWYLRAGSTSLVKVTGSTQAQPSPVVSDGQGAWQSVQPGATPNTAQFTAPIDGWYLLAAWPIEPAPHQVRLRVLVPADAQAAPTAGVA
ncbi:MAG: hypothetical protein JWM25_1677 [Thermoleophilia bacterium]|nr:hypothetical protein [Thermoleophilia bacterium]